LRHAEQVDLVRCDRAAVPRATARR
jgi:hypothetical protein